MPQLVEVRFKGNRKAYFEWHESEPLRAAEPVVVESERGLDFGTVTSTGATAQTKCDRCSGCALGAEEGGESRRREMEPTRKVVRRASSGDRRTHEDLRRTEDDVRRKVREKAQQHGLQMKVSDAEWQWDRNKLTVYFTAEKRVDFRQLVRDLASTFRTRIELRQIGVRDEAARLSGIGRCGREYCSASWLPELRPIGLQIAKDQRLSLNPAQISGPCGRLLCCLRYEHEFYVQSRKRFPKEGKVLQTARGAEKVYSIDIFRDRVTLRSEDGTSRIVELADLRREVEEAAAGVPGAPRPGPASEAATRGGGVRTERAPSPGSDRQPTFRPGEAQKPRPGVSSTPAAPATTDRGTGAADAPPPGEEAGSAPAAREGEQRRRRRRRRRRKGSPPGEGTTPP